MVFEFFKAVILGLIEGITEFLPISSTGHLILANQWLAFDSEFTVLFDIVIQFGAILSVVVYFRKKLWPWSKDGRPQESALKIWQKTFLAVLPALFFGFLLDGLIEEKLFNPLTVALTLLAGGIVLIILEKKARPIKFPSVENLPFQAAFLIGLFQCLAMIPGTSRSAATIIGAMLLGASRVAAAEFSFFLAVPTMLAASAFSLFKYGIDFSPSELAILLTGFGVSFLTAWTVIKFFLDYIQKNDFKIFGYYRLILGAIILSLFLI